MYAQSFQVVPFHQLSPVANSLVWLVLCYYTTEMEEMTSLFLYLKNWENLYILLFAANLATWERERERGGDIGCVCVCVRERERERESSLEYSPVSI